jgi:hypothetical protein
MGCADRDATMWNPLRRRKNSLNRSFTSVLFDPPSFLAGMARSIDMGNTLTDYNKSMTPEQADHNALAADWLAVGRDFRIALDTVVASDQRLNEEHRRIAQQRAKLRRSPLRSS